MSQATPNGRLAEGLRQSLMIGIRALGRSFTSNFVSEKCIGLSVIHPLKEETASFTLFQKFTQGLNQCACRHLRALYVKQTAEVHILGQPEEE